VLKQRLVLRVLEPPQVPKGLLLELAQLVRKARLPELQERRAQRVQPQGQPRLEPRVRRQLELLERGLQGLAEPGQQVPLGQALRGLEPVVGLV
jgi:hypothetical protein